MFGFGKKKKTTVPTPEQQPHMRVIPDIFYGGNDPVIYHASKGQGRTASRGDNASSQLHGGLTTPERTSWFVGRKKILVMSLAGLILLSIVGVATWYYVAQAIRQSAPEPAQKVPELVIDTIPEAPVVVIEPETPTTTAVAEETLPVESTEPTVPPVSFPRILLIDAPDADADELTDHEEILFATNQDVWDTDSDGYYDGQEVANLYNPNGVAPVKLIDSGFVTEYLNPIWKYRLYYPTAWQVGQVDPEGRQVLFSTLSGDFIEVRVFDRTPGMLFQDWFARTVEGEKFQDIVPFTNRFLEPGWKRKDGLVAYVLSDTFVTVLIYHPGVSGAVSYRHVMNVVIQSFRPTKSSIQIPEQAPLPRPPVFTTSTTSSASQSEIF